jgi:hypothetical protein
MSGCQVHLPVIARSQQHALPALSKAVDKTMADCQIMFAVHHVKSTHVCLLIAVALF